MFGMALSQLYLHGWKRLGQPMNATALSLKALPSILHRLHRLHTKVKEKALVGALL
jgi:hypothetical protein